jgi:pimeloyl-ACP methyl ester carboxylesterase
MFEAIQGPTLVVRGAQSDLLMRETWPRWWHAASRCRASEIPDVGHAPTFVDPAQIAIARQFFLGLEPFTERN